MSEIDLSKLRTVRDKVFESLAMLSVWVWARVIEVVQVWREQMVALGGVLWRSLDLITPKLVLASFLIPMLGFTPYLVLGDFTFTLTWLDANTVFSWWHMEILFGVGLFGLVMSESPYVYAGISCIPLVYVGVLMTAISDGGISILGSIGVTYLVAMSLGLLMSIKTNFRLQIALVQMAEIEMVQEVLLKKISYGNEHGAVVEVPAGDE